MQLSFGILLFCFSILNSCTSEDDTTRKPFEYDLSIHPGSKNFEVILISPSKKDVALKFMYDTIAKHVFLYCVDYLKINNNGEIIDSISEGGIGYYHSGVLELNNEISEWLINGNKQFTRVGTIIAPQKNEFEIFDKDYNEATYFFLSDGYPRFKINGKWIRYKPPVPDDLLGYLASDLSKIKYPEKPKGRFIPMPEVGPDLGIPPKERDTSLLKSLGYVPVDVKKENWGLSSHNYSAGFYNMEIYMPGGDTIQFRHFGSLGPDISLYRVPEKYGGRKDILFVTQDYNYLYPEQSVGGVYVIRPKKF